MADFTPAFEKTIANEGGYILHEVSGDKGGLTYAGIAENYHPDWEGWQLLKNDPDSPKIEPMVRSFYKKQFWDKVKGDDIASQKIADSLFDFSVNTGVRTASKLAQIVVNAAADGIIGRNSTAALNKFSEELFISNYALAKIARYAKIVTKDKSQKKFLLGWVNRTLAGLK